MILWTIQPADVCRSLQERGSLHADPELWTDMYPSLEAAYRWMTGQMARRIPGFRGHYPWWAWRQWALDRPRPDLRNVRTYRSGSNVLLKLDVPDQEVLLSDYNAWHAVINVWPIADTEAEYEILEQEISDRQQTSRPFDEELDRKIQKSWERIFDLDGLKTHWMYPEGSVQACFETLRWRDVKRVQVFEGARKTA